MIQAVGQRTTVVVPAAQREPVQSDLVRLLIFDLDGTLVDSKKDLVDSVNATRAHSGLGPMDADSIASHVGNGAPALVRGALGPGYTDDEVRRALEFFLGWYRDHMLDHTRLYPGVQDALDQLRDGGVRMAVLTNKPVRFSQTMIDRLGLGSHFFRVYGGNSFEQKKPHPVGVEKLLAEAEVDRGQAMMIGDSAVDVLTARNAGIRSCGVRYGFQPESFEAEPPDVLVDGLTELAHIVLEGRAVFE